MVSLPTFRQDMLNIVERRHSKRHPLIGPLRQRQEPNRYLTSHS